MSRLSGKSLVVFDANAETVIMLEAWFETLGVTAHGTSITPSHTSMRTLLHQKRPDVIIVDVPLPYDANIRVLHELSAAGVFGKTPVVVTTTNARVVAGLARSMNFHIRHFVEKPYDMNVLMQSLTAVIAAPALCAIAERNPNRALDHADSDLTEEIVAREPAPMSSEREESECDETAALRREFQMRRDRWLRTELRSLA